MISIRLVFTFESYSVQFELKEIVFMVLLSLVKLPLVIPLYEQFRLGEGLG